MVLLRAYTLSDRYALIGAINSVCAEGMMATPSFQPTPAWEHALARPDCPHHLLLVAEAEERIIGWCRLFPEGLCDSPSVLELGIGVVAPWRRQGIGRALVHRALEWAADKGFPRIVLYTRADNQPAQHLFIQSGFSSTQTQDCWLEMVWPPSSNSGVRK